MLSAAKRSADYAQFLGPAGDVRPGHTDLVKHYKSGGHTDPRGGGRSSYRSTISDVVGGAVARRFLAERFGTAFFSSICQVGEIESGGRLSDAVGDGRLTPDEAAALEARLEEPELRTLDAGFSAEAARLIEAARKEGDSVGAALEIVAVNVPPLIGEPLYDSLKLRLMGSLGGLHAVQSCEMGSGREVVARRGSGNNDPIRSGGYRTNHHGGLIGGITTGSPLVFRVGFKPTATIARPQTRCARTWRRSSSGFARGATIRAWGCAPGSPSSRGWRSRWPTPCSPTRRRGSTRTTSASSTAGGRERLRVRGGRPPPGPGRQRGHRHTEAGSRHHGTHARGGDHSLPHGHGRPPLRRGPDPAG